MEFSIFDSYIEPNLSNLIMNQEKTKIIRRKVTDVKTSFTGRVQFRLIFQIEKLDCTWNFTYWTSKWIDISVW